MSDGAPIFHFGRGLLPTEVTLPTLDLCHYITDDELGRIGEMRHQLLGETLFLLVGVTFGLLIPAVDEISRFNSAEDPMDVEGLIICIVAGMTLMASLVLFCIWWSRRRAQGDMIAQIRNRKRVVVVPSPTEPRGSNEMATERP